MSDFVLTSDTDEVLTPPEKEHDMEVSSTNVLSEKSKKIYEKNYEKFMVWKKSKKLQSFSENVLLAYFQELSKKCKSSTLWKECSMLKSTLIIYQQTNIAKYSKLYAFLKRQADGCKVKKSKVFLPNEVKTFLDTAPDQQYLATKVGLVFGITGACRRQELQRIQFTDVKDLHSTILVYVSNPKTKIYRTFTISGKFYDICKNYMNLRPNPCRSPNFFLRYCNGQCIEQNVGINTFGKMGKTIATYLKLSNPGQYTGHCFRRTSATLLVNAVGDITQRHGPPSFPKSNMVAEGHIDESLQNKALQDLCSYSNRSRTLTEDQIPLENPEKCLPQVVVVKSEAVIRNSLELEPMKTRLTDLIEDPISLETPQQSMSFSEVDVKPEALTIDEYTDSEHAHSSQESNGAVSLHEPAWGVMTELPHALSDSEPCNSNDATQKSTLEEILACLTRLEHNAERAARAQEAQALALQKIVQLLGETERRQ